MSAKDKSQLYLKGGIINKKLLGDCFKCHQVLLIKQLKNVDVDVTFISECTKPTSMLPVLKSYPDDDEIQGVNEIAAYLVTKGSGEYSLSCDNVVANNLANTATPMSSLSGWIKNTDPYKDESLKNKFHKTLEKIDKDLGSTEGNFLDGDRIKIPDCILLPKLYHAKIVAKHIKEYDFTKEFKNIGRYLDAAQKIKEFRESCPEECEIKEKWKDKIPKK